MRPSQTISLFYPLCTKVLFLVIIADVKLLTNLHTGGGGGGGGGGINAVNMNSH